MPDIDTSLAALRALAEAATRGPWRVEVNRMPYSFVGQDGTPHVGEHIERHIVTVRDHPQSKAPDRIVTRSIGVGYLDEPPISMVYIRSEDADYLAAVSPEVVLGLLDAIAAEKEAAQASELSGISGDIPADQDATVKPDLTVDAAADSDALIRTLRANLASAEEARDQAVALAEVDKVEITAWKTRALRAEADRDAAIARAEKAEAERDAALRLLADRPGPGLSGRAFTTVATTVLAARKPCDPADPCPVAQDIASENRTLDGLLAEAKERAKDAEARAEKMRTALLGVVKDFDDLISESEGVAGLHLNGDLAPWRELIDGGRFDTWTGGLTEARALLAEQEADRG